MPNVDDVYILVFYLLTYLLTYLLIHSFIHISLIHTQITKICIKEDKEENTTHILRMSRTTNEKNT